MIILWSVVCYELICPNNLLQNGSQLTIEKVKLVQYFCICMWGKPMTPESLLRETQCSQPAD